MKIRAIPLLVWIILLLGGCQDKADFECLYFIGDSNIARWDLQVSFPSFATVNQGVSGACIDYVESLAGRYEGEEVVLLIGTNDVKRFDEESLDAYCSRYVMAVSNLKAKHILLLSIPPRSYNFAWEGANEATREMNAAIRERVVSMDNVTYVDIYYALSHDGALNPQYTLDGLHLNIYGYEVLAKAIFNNLNLK